MVWTAAQQGYVPAVLPQHIGIISDLPENTKNMDNAPSVEELSSLPQEDSNTIAPRKTQWPPFRYPRDGAMWTLSVDASSSAVDGRPSVTGKVGHSMASDGTRQYFAGILSQDLICLQSFEDPWVPLNFDSDMAFLVSMYNLFDVKHLAVDFDCDWDPNFNHDVPFLPGCRLWIVDYSLQRSEKAETLETLAKDRCVFHTKRSRLIEVQESDEGWKHFRGAGGRTPFDFIREVWKVGLANKTVERRDIAAVLGVLAVLPH